MEDAPDVLVVDLNVTVHAQAVQVLVNQHVLDVLDAVDVLE